MNGKYFLIFVILISLILPSAYSFDIRECVGYTKQWEIAKCYHDIAIELNDSSICEKSEQYSGNCYYQIAVKTNNFLLCEKALKFRSECHRYFAFKNENFSMCFEENKDECILSEIKNTKNYELCKKATNPQDCFESIYYDTKNNKICQFLKNTSKSDIFQECFCADNEMFRNGSCANLGCKPHQKVEKRSCIDYCEVGKIYDDNDWLYPCKYPCKFGINRNTIQLYINYRWNCNDWSKEIPFYYSLEIPALFLLFCIIILLSYYIKKKIFKNSLFREYISYGLKYMFILLNITIFIFLFERQPTDLVDSFYGDTSVFIEKLALLFFIPFAIGLVTTFILKLIRQKNTKYLFIIENLIYGVGISIFMYFLRWVVLFFEERLIAIYLYPWYFKEYLLYALGSYSFYLSPFIEPLYTLIFFIVLISLIRYLYNMFIRKAWQSIFVKVPKFIFEIIKVFFIFAPLLIFLALGEILSSLRFFADWLIQIGLEELLIKYTDVKLLDTRIYYSNIIYSFALAMLFVLAKYSAQMLINKIKFK